MTEKNNINVFISSKNRDYNSTPYSFNCYFPEGLISCLPSQGIKVNIVSFDLINSMYNMNNNNNKFELMTTDLDGNNPNTISYTIPVGNYNVNQIADWINANQSYMTISYNSITNKYTYNKIDTNVKLYLKIVSSGSFLGYENGSTVEITHVVSDSKLNIVYSNKVIVRATNLNFEVASLENINTYNTNDNFEISNILLWCSKNDIAPFQVITYNNYDGGNSYSYNLYNRTINHIHFLITNEYDEVIEDLPDWTMSIQFSIYERKDDEMVKLLTIINSYLREIYVFMNIFYSYIIKY